MSRQTVNAVESDKYGPTLALGMKLARLLETPVEELFTLEAENGPPELIRFGGRSRAVTI